MTASAEPFLERYLSGQLADFFALPAGDLAAALGRELERPRLALAAELRGQAERLGAPAGALSAAERLAHPRSRVVVTGQQPGLLLAPAYTIAKAISAVRLARRLDSEDAPVLALFWVASQDHDTAEVDHAFLLDRRERLHRLRLDLPADVPSGRIPYRPGWTAELARGLGEVGGKAAHVEEARLLVEASAERAASFSDLFAGILWRLLGEDGLLVLDPLGPGVAPLFAGLLRRELEDPLGSVSDILEAAEGLRRLGLEPQLGRGRGATNLFLEERGAGLPRRRLLRFDGRLFHTPERSYHVEELLEVLDSDPSRLTPAAGLRPVAQDAVLPTAAFVVGPGELRYVAQLGGVYRRHAVPMPLIWPRASAVVLEPPVRRILRRYDLDYARFAAERQGALERVLLERHGHAVVFERALRELHESSLALTHHVSAIDPTLEGTVRRADERFERTVQLLRGKAAAALARRDATTRRQFARLEAQLFPSGQPQERLLSPFSFFLKFGVEPMMQLYRTVGESGERLLEP